MEIGSSVRSTLWKGAYNLLQRNMQKTDSTYILDPFSVMVVLASNAYKPTGTKLFISNGRLELHDASIFQGTVRTISGENKMNIKLINHPIIYVCMHYFSKSTTSPSEDIVFVFKKAIEGLENLKHTYRDDRDIKASINSYINIISSCFDSKHEVIDILEVILRLKLSDVAYGSAANETNSVTSVKSNLFEELHKNWDINKIATSIGILKELENATPYGKQLMFTALDSFMAYIHEKTKQTIENVFEVK